MIRRILISFHVFQEALSQLSPLQFVLETLNDACQNPDAVGVFNPNSLILSKHTLSANLYKKLATKTPVDAKLDHSKKASALRTKPEFHDAELSDGREDATRNIIIKETKKRNQRYYDMRSGSGLSRDSSEYSSESPEVGTGNRQTQTLHILLKERTTCGKPKCGIVQKRTPMYDRRLRMQTGNFRLVTWAKTFFPQGKAIPARYHPSKSLRSGMLTQQVQRNRPGVVAAQSGLDPIMGRCQGTLKGYEKTMKLKKIMWRLTRMSRSTLRESRRTPVSEPEDGAFARPHDFVPKSRSLDDIISVHSDPESTRVQTRQRPRSFVSRDPETGAVYESKSLNVEKDWKPARNAPGSPLLRRIDKFQRQSVSSSSSGGSLGAKTNSREMLEREGRSYPHNQRFVKNLRFLLQFPESSSHPSKVESRCSCNFCSNFRLLIDLNK